MVRRPWGAPPADLPCQPMPLGRWRTEFPKDIQANEPPMTVYFYEPPMRQKVGGLDLAVRSLRSYLLRSGVSVKGQTDFGTDNSNADYTVIHSHGLLQPRFPKASNRSRP